MVWLNSNSLSYLPQVFNFNGNYGFDINNVDFILIVSNYPEISLIPCKTRHDAGIIQNKIKDKYAFATYNKRNNNYFTLFDAWANNPEGIIGDINNNKNFINNGSGNFYSGDKEIVRAQFLTPAVLSILAIYGAIIGSLNLILGIIRLTR